MSTISPVFKQTYKDYLSRIAVMDLKTAGENLGVRVQGKNITVPLFGKHFIISKNSISGPSGKKPSFDICIILCKYILLCPERIPDETAWVSFRDFKDSGPLTTYFSHDVERAIAEHISGKTNDMSTAISLLGGHAPDIDASYDLSIKFDVLPRVPMLLLFNDADEGFPAHCSVLFEKRADTFLDAECLAIAGRLLFSELTALVPALL